MHNQMVIYRFKKKKQKQNPLMFTNLNEAKISSRKQGHSPTINGLYYAIQTT